MNTRKSILEKSETQKTSAKGTILIALMFLNLMSPKAWGYAEKELPSSFSEQTFSSNENIYLSRAVLADENGQAICQVNLQENPEFLPGFAESGSSDLRPLDLPECEEQSLDIVAQYAEQAWVKKDVALLPFVVMAAAGCVASFIDISPAVAGGALGVASGAANILGIIHDVRFLSVHGVVTTGATVLAATAVTAGVGAGLGFVGGLVCSGIAGRIFYEKESNEKDL